MNLHEYQSKALFRKYGLPVSDGEIAYTPKEAEKVAYDLGGELFVVKAQVHAGGRGKGGGVKLGRSPKEAREIASKIIGMNLVTPQTGAQGKLVSKVLVEKGCDIEKEYYLSLLVDRATGGVAFVVSEEGGVEIEEVAKHNPQKIFNVAVPPESGYSAYIGRKIAQFLRVPQVETAQLVDICNKLYQIFIDCDLAMLEINPLVLKKGGGFILLDAKLGLDDNALYRQKEIARLIDFDENDDRELEATRIGINYVALDGNIGCMVNGAGLAMATMDVIQAAGGKPANFLDVGGGATKEMVTSAFKLILADSAVKGVFVNIFGGIMKCDIIANGVVEAAKELGIKVPVVVRLQGTNVEEGRKILENSGLKLVPEGDLEKAAKKIVELSS